MDTQTIERPVETGGSSDSGPSRQVQQDQATRASLEAAYDKIERRERAVERAPVIEDQFRAKASGERVLREHEDYHSEGLPPYRGSPATVTDSLNAAADRAFAREAAKKARQMPELGADVPLRERLEKSVEWAELSDRDKVQFRRGHDEAAEQRKAAKWFGLDLAESKAIEIEARMAAQDRVRPVLDRYQKLVPHQDPTTTMSTAAAWAEALQRNPQAAYKQLGERLGLGPIDLQQQQAAQYQQQLQMQRQQQYAQRAAAARQQAVVRAVSTAVDSFAASHPDVDALQDRIIHTLGTMRRTGNAMADLRSAYRLSGGRYAV
jgi:hypothetical protein